MPRSDPDPVLEGAEEKGSPEPEDRSGAAEGRRSEVAVYSSDSGLRGMSQGQVEDRDLIEQAEAIYGERVPYASQRTEPSCATEPTLPSRSRTS